MDDFSVTLKPTGVFEQFEGSTMSEIWRNPELPDAERASDPIASFHEQHCFLSFTDMADGDRGQRL